MEYSLINVLVIDDEPSVRESLSEFLEDFDFNVKSAESAEDALGLMEKSHFDVAIVDLRLPGMNGDIMIEKAHLKFPNIRFLIHTGSTNYNLPDILKNIGMKNHHVYLKPQLDMNIFIEGIESLINKNK